MARKVLLKITSCADSEWWYSTCVGKRYEATLDGDEYLVPRAQAPEAIGKATGGYVIKSDCKILKKL